MYITLKKNWYYLLLLLVVIAIVSFFTWNVYVTQSKPIHIFTKSTNPLLKNLKINDTLVENSLRDYNYIQTKNVFFAKQPFATRQKQITINITQDEQLRFAYKPNGKIAFGSGSIDLPTELIINIYLSKDYISRFVQKNDMKHVQASLNRLFILELYVNSPRYKDEIRHTSGIPLLLKLGNQPTKDYIQINND